MAAGQNISNLSSTDFKSVARALTIVENDLPGADELLKGLRFDEHTPIIGITGPPGAGKSTLVNALISQLVEGDKSVAILAIDPTSPFNLGSLLGDRIRMSGHFNHPRVFIRSLATRGSLGGLSAKTIEMADVLRAAGFDHVLIETVGVGQSEIEIAGLADLTFVVLVPEAGDEIQNIKSGLMEIADAFIINKADRDDADLFANNLQKVLHQKADAAPPIFKTVATTGSGIDEITTFIATAKQNTNTRKAFLLAEKAYKLMQQKRMADINKVKLREDVAKAMNEAGFNLYSFIEKSY